MRVSYNFNPNPVRQLGNCRNPTFNGCGFHIQIWHRRLSDDL